MFAQKIAMTCSGEHWNDSALPTDYGVGLKRFQRSAPIKRHKANRSTERAVGCLYLSDWTTHLVTQYIIAVLSTSQQTIRLSDIESREGDALEACRDRRVQSLSSFFHVDAAQFSTR